MIGACLMLAGVYTFLAHRGVLRWLAAAVVVLTPVAILVLFALHSLIWVALASIALIRAGGRRRPEGAGPGSRRHGHAHPEVPPPKRAFLIMNPRSGGGKVAKFGLKEKAEALGAEVALLEGPGMVDVAALARQAVADGADLLGVAGGDGTQALVAGIAAEHDLPFLVISAGTRNHFAMDLGLDRDDPAACLDALTGRRRPADRPRHHRRPDVREQRLVRRLRRDGAEPGLPRGQGRHDAADAAGPPERPPRRRAAGRAGDTTVTGPQALLVSNNPYEMGDIAGLGRRARLDAGTLGVVAVTVNARAGGRADPRRPRPG